MQRYNIYHLARRDGSAFFLTPFSRRGSFLQIPANVELFGYFGAEPRVESLTLLRNELYRRIDEDVRDWINEKRFIPRFLVSSAVFLVVFLFLSLVVHTPIPLLDELLGSGAAAVITFILLGRHFEQSRSASQRRATLRAQVDNVVFTESAHVHAVEKVLHQLERSVPAMPVLTPGGGLPDEAVDVADQVGAVWKEDSESTRMMLEMLRQQILLPAWKRAARDIRRNRMTRKTEEAIASGSVYPPIILLYQELSRHSP